MWRPQKSSIYKEIKQFSNVHRGEKELDQQGHIIAHYHDEEVTRKLIHYRAILLSFDHGCDYGKAFTVKV
jgi:hypothetical protein